jgi:hypothetical protein
MEPWSAEAGDIRGVCHRRTRGAWLAATLPLAAMGRLLLGPSRWVRHYNEGRAHMALGPGIPQPPAALPVSTRIDIGGLHHEYRLDAKAA